ncbi:hypothetical protein Cgig2_030449 [Carnegiea gigantea]|uniref:S1 motif domain-containing protein n=1 Tax=Carnegiea gigantea TaxID=171969 RepID=A0A9Q1KPJ4_9CARY|nr:hypothetical protein Cgig2_030449 [Carnegiea gigantea]
MRSGRCICSSVLILSLSHSVVYSGSVVGSMALMDAGIPVREHVAGVSVGLVSEVDPLTGEITDYRIVTDILGLEDHLGDMDFKIAGTRNGVTAIQLDIKPAGIPLDIICECLEPALRGRLQILDHMEREIKAPRNHDDRNSPKLVTLKYSNDSIRRLIGPLGALKRKIEEETGSSEIYCDHIINFVVPFIVPLMGNVQLNSQWQFADKYYIFLVLMSLSGARISVGDGTLTVVAKNQSVMDKVQEKIDFIIGREIEVGGVYKGIVTAIKEYGAFVEFNGGQQGLLHISELSHDPVSRVADVVSTGQQLSLRCIGMDVRGNIKLSLKATLPRSEKESSHVDDGSTSARKSSSPVWASVCDAIRSQAKLGSEEEPVTKYETEKVKSSTASSTSFMIRNSVKCDEEEKSDTSRPFTSSNPSFLIRSAAECNEEEKSAGLGQDSSVGSQPSSDSESGKTSKVPFQKGKKVVAGSGISVKDLRLGTKVTAKVYQIRARGLVLDLGGGLKGMYRFEANGKTNCEVGDELRVQCCSFTAKGVPVMSLVKDE